jgi:hypothetical protein
MKLTRTLLLIHRYVGIGIGLLMLMWCLSGIVMMYVRYPELPDARRLAALRPLDLNGCCAAGLDPTRTVARLNIEMLAGHPVMRVIQTGPARLIDLSDGKPIEHITADQALSVALTYSVNPGAPTLIDHDQWTVSGGFGHDRPLYRFAFDDPDRTQLYVSGTTGKAVQITTAPQRFWNWLGAIPHWFYFTRLRAEVALWNQVVIWTSLLGCFLAGTGLYLGIRQFRWAPDGRWSPYRGFMLWHHLLGLMFGLFALSWVASGLISMNPWGFLDSDEPSEAATLLRGKMQSGADIAVALPALAAALPPGIVSIKSAPFGGQLAFVAIAANGERMRISASGKSITPPDMSGAASYLRGDPPILMSTSDNYYFDSRSETARLPAYRVIATDGARYYLDPLSGDIVKTVDANARWYRWLHEAPHRLDFSAALRARPLWDMVMLTLMLGVTCICGTGTWLGLQRLRQHHPVSPPTLDSTDK